MLDLYLRPSALTAAILGVLGFKSLVDASRAFAAYYTAKIKGWFQTSWGYLSCSLQNNVYVNK